ncbi:ZIP metal ion transporter [Artemisia annua]|uniref:ZIP metal ion transporter n=1 Tax=Artemisia annua TaxID=35608 RepID=A0A2U1LDS4_ARTAN|nr:ZIP metal ion transporter [Artemisia annua]
MSLKLPEELAEEEDLRMEFMPLDSSNGMLTLGELGFSIQGKPSKAFVDALAVFGAGAMLGDAFLHQLPHAFVGIVVFLFVEKDVNGDDDKSEKRTPDDEKSSEPSGESLKKDKQSESSVLRKRNTVTNGVEDKTDSTAENGPESNTKSMVEKEPVQSSSLVLGYLNLFSDGVRNTVTNGVEDKTDSTAENGPESNTKSMVEKEPVQSSSLVLGYLNLFSDGVHNFTDGMALGSAFLLYGSVGGWSRTLFLLAHELPQEIGDFGILVRSGFSVSKALFFNFLSALVALAGTALALSLGQDPGQSSLIEGFTAGGFIYIAVGVMAEMNNGSSSLKNSAIQLTSLVMD